MGSATYIIRHLDLKLGSVRRGDSQLNEGYPSWCILLKLRFKSPFSVPRRISIVVFHQTLFRGYPPVRSSPVLSECLSLFRRNHLLLPNSIRTYVLILNPSTLSDLRLVHATRSSTHYLTRVVWIFCARHDSPSSSFMNLLEVTSPTWSLRLNAKIGSETICIYHSTNRCPDLTHGRDVVRRILYNSCLYTECKSETEGLRTSNQVLRSSWSLFWCRCVPLPTGCPSLLVGPPSGPSVGGSREV